MSESSKSSAKTGTSSTLTLYSTAQENSLSSRGASASNGATSTSGSLEPGSALSKLLDSAMANAAKELTPEPETAKSSTLLASPRRSSMLDFKPLPSSKAYMYSIEELLTLRSEPEIANFDTSVLPDNAFWVIRPTRPPKTTNEKNGAGRRRDRRNQNQNQQGDSSGRWERKPTGFAKSSELDRMSAEKISQLLGENPEEGAPEWDNPGGSDLQMDMGSTVEDFERWKQRMRDNERKQYGEVETPSEPEAPKGNEVDNFFSFVNPKSSGPAPEAATAASSEGKSSRFSSFFGGPGPEESPKRSGPPPGLTSRAPAGRPAEASGLRFFGLAHGSPAQQNLTPKKEPASLQSHQQPPLPPQGLSPMAGQGIPLSGGPPGLGPMNLGGDSKNQDSFFLSLLNKREQDQSAGSPGIPKEDKPRQASQPQQRGSKPEGKPSPVIPGQGAPTGPGGPGGPGGPQGIPPWMTNPGMGPPPGFPGGPQHPQHMYQFQGPPPPGMFPPGMAPPQGMPPQGYPGMQGRPGQSQDGQPNQQGIPRGQMPPPGFFGFPPGMGPGMPPPPPHQQQQQQQQQQQPQQPQQPQPKQ